LKGGGTQIQFAEEDQWKLAIANRYNSYAKNTHLIIKDNKKLSQD